MKNDAELSPPPEASNPTPSGVVPPVLTGGGPVPTGRVKDLLGRRFGRLKVVSYAGVSSRGAARWSVLCDCGAQKIVSASSLISKHTTSCGCYQRERCRATHLVELAGRRFGRWTVLRYAKTNKHGCACWIARCDCGTIRQVSGVSLMHGKSTSCGCLTRERVSETTRLKLTGARFGRLLVASFAGVDQQGRTVWAAKCDCGRTHLATGHALTSGDVTSCGCYHSEVMSARRGHLNPNWNPQLSDEDRGARRLGTTTERAWSCIAKLARNRDGYRCIVCGRKNYRLVVHHLEPWLTNKNLRYELANLVTLCEPCHVQFHTLYGLDADLDDFIDFLK